MKNKYLRDKVKLIWELFAMATIRKLPSGKWNVQIRGKGKIFASGTFATRGRAERFAQQKGLELGLGHPPFLDAGHMYCHNELANRPSQALAANRIDRICKFKKMRNRMDRITLKDVNAFKQHRLAEVTQATCRDELLMIRRVYRWYIRELVSEGKPSIQNPCELITMPKPSKPRDRVVSRDELMMLLSAMSPQMALITELAYETAMRRSEILRLTPHDLHLEDRFLCVVDGKEGDRDVPLTKRAVELLRESLTGISDRNARIYPVAAYSVTQAVRRAREAVGLDSDVRFHQLRHSRITEVARKGLNQAQIMMVSGHRDIRSVQRYTHLNVQDVVGLID